MPEYRLDVDHDDNRSRPALPDLDTCVDPWHDSRSSAGTCPSCGFMPTLEQRIRALLEREAAHPCAKHPKLKPVAVECDMCTAYEVDTAWIQDLRAALFYEERS